MSESDKDFWFYAKSFGVGWFLPARWQGWVVYAVYTLMLIGVRPVISTSEYRTAFIAFVTVMLVAVVVWKGERPIRWRWGGL